MLARTCFVVATAIGATLSGPASACDPATGERSQTVIVGWNNSLLTTLSADSQAVQVIELPSGFTLGLKLEPAEAGVYLRDQEHATYSPELVKISLFELTGTEPRLMTHTYGGTNSVQVYGARGGADRVVQLGDPGIVLTLLKPVCVSAQAIAQAQ